MNRDEVSKSDSAYPQEIGLSCVQNVWPNAYFTKENPNINKYSLEASISAQLTAPKCQMRWWIKEIHLQCISQRWD